MMTDPIADMLTRIRNAQMRETAEVVLPNSKTKLAIAKIMFETGYLTDVKTTKNGAFTSLVLGLRTDGHIRSIRRISKPGRRIYAKAGRIPRVLNGRGIMIVSTSRGMMTDRAARAQHLGGELICEVQ